jgi:hypothetical protein
MMAENMVIASHILQVKDNKNLKNGDNDICQSMTEVYSVRASMVLAQLFMTLNHVMPTLVTSVPMLIFFQEISTFSSP